MNNDMDMEMDELDRDEKRPRLAILQRVCPGYRTALFTALTANKEFYCKLFIGQDIPNSKVRSTHDLDGIRYKKLSTRFFKLGHRVFPYHVDLIKELREFKPDVILCEGESHFLGYLQAIWYRFFYKKVGLIHWCFISLPGETRSNLGVANLIKSFTRRFFNAFLLYSTYSKNALTRLGIPAEKAFVATNVGDVKKFLELSANTDKTSSDARRRLKLPERFTVLYTGTLDRNKNPDMMLDLAKACNPSEFNFLLLGEGEMLEELRARAVAEGLQNVFLLGRIGKELPDYYRASDVLLIPGRGGIIISEAMAFGIPVIVHEADGTEYDLVEDSTTGIHLKSGKLRDFKEAIEYLHDNPAKSADMGRAGKALVETKFTTENMVKQITAASIFAMNASGTR